MTDDNPYQVTDVTNAEPLVISKTEPSKTGIIIGWMVVFGINLPIPVFFGSGIVSGTVGYLGMTLGCVLWCGTGILLCRRGWARHIRATSWGGLIVALSQFYPMLQFFAGMAAVEIMRVLSIPIGGYGPNGIQPMNVSAVFDVMVATGLTVLTGTILISVAAVVGHVLLFLFRSWGSTAPQQVPLKEV